MKLNIKTFCILLFSILLVSMFILSGCRKSEPKVAPTPPTEQKPEIKYVERTAGDPKGDEGWTLLTEYATDLDADNQEEQIGLFTSAQRDSKGNIMWDDGQKWLLSVKDGDGYYPLFREYVQLGSVYYTVATHENNTTPKITVLVSTGAGLTLTNYAYEAEKKGYKVEPVYDSKTINLQFTSLPSYE